MHSGKRALGLIVTVLLVSNALAVPTSPDASNQSQSANSVNDSDRRHSQVLIIGAGPSGVAAASRLMQNGILDVTILEAEDRIGGRTNSAPFGNDVVDLGAQWVSGSVGNVVYEMASPLGLLEEGVPSPFLKWRFMQTNGTVPDQDVLHRLLNISLDISEEKDPMSTYSGTFGQYFLERYAQQTSDEANNVNSDPALVTSFVRWVEKLFAFAEGADSWHNVSAKGLNGSWDCDGDQVINWIHGGYSSIIDLLTKRYPDPAQELPVRNKTHLRTEVKTIHWGPYARDLPDGKKTVLVETTDGTQYTADIVLVTVSVGVIKEQAATLFSPPLPAKNLNAAQHIGFGQVDKLFVEFNETWWPTDITGFSVVASEEDSARFNQLYPQYLEKGEWATSLTGLYAVPRQPKVLFDWLVGEPARNMEKYSDDEVKDAWMKWAAMFLGREIPAPTAFIRSKWYTNPHFRGSYTHAGVAEQEHNIKRADLAEPLKGQSGNLEVLFAGEATDEHHYGYVHGAIETGWREADRILQILRHEKR